MAMKYFKWTILDFPLRKFTKNHRMRNYKMLWMMEVKTIISLKIITSLRLIN
jgi:hypothetical protein